MKCISFGPCVALIGSVLISVPQGFSQDAMSKRTGSIDGRSQVFFAYYDEDASESNLRAARRRRHRSRTFVQNVCRR